MDAVIPSFGLLFLILFLIGYIIFSIKQLIDQSKASKMINEYNKYAPGQVFPKRYTKEEAAKMGALYQKQIGESFKIISETIKPEIFFQRYGFMLQRTVELQRMGHYAPSNGIKPDQLKENLINSKSEKTKRMIDRAALKCQQRNDTLKTRKAKQNSVIKLKEQFEAHREEMDDQTQAYLDSVLKKLEPVNEIIIE